MNQTSRPHLTAPQFIVLDPGHFHAALVLKESYAGADPTVSVYAPLGNELLDFLERVRLFNSRAVDPTSWHLKIDCAPDALAQMLACPQGNIVVLAGENDTKIERILASVQAGLNVLADKPWIISSADLPKLEESLHIAEEQNLIAYDIMTERYEITSQIQRELVNTPEVFGTLQTGAPNAPAVRARSVHNVMKLVSGVPLRRPAWFFDINVQGEALADVGTHVVDLIQWTAFPDTAVDYRADIEVLAARHWPLTITPDQFQAVTGESRATNLDYFCNNCVNYTLRGIHVAVEVTWDWQAPPGAGDVYEASFQGTNARVVIRQGEAERHRPELYVMPATPALGAAIERLQSRWPGLDVAETNGEARIVIPDRYREGHEAHFAQVTRRFFEYLRDPGLLPQWETPNMLAKYYVTTRGVEISRA